jgi:hypothetical protein
MLIKKILLNSLLLGCAGIISCTDLSGSSSLGQDVVNSVDPNRTNFNNSFLFSDTVKSTETKSIASPNDTLLGYNETVTIVGNQSNREARGMVFFSLNGTYKKTHTKDTLMSVYLRLPSTSDSVKGCPKDLQVYDGSVHTLLTRYSLSGYKTIAQSDSAYDSTSKKVVFKGFVNDVPFTSSIADAFKTSDTTTSYFRFLITNTDTFFKLSPTATLIFEFKRDTAIIKDSISSFRSSYTIFEESTFSASRDTQPITSSETGRKAVFVLDMKPFWKSKSEKPGFTELLSATLTLRDSLLPGRDTSDAVPFRYYVSPIQFTDINTLRDSMSISDSIATIDNTGKISVHAEKFLRNLSPSTEVMYLYLSNTKSSTIQQETLWREPVITAVFTNTL